MSVRSLNGLSTNNVRSLNGLEGIGIESIVGGDAIAITTATGSRTINVDISKQGATSSIADTDLFLLETSSGVIKKITGANLKSESDTNFWSRTGTNIQQLTTGDTLTLDYQTDATYVDTLLIKNTNAGTDILTYKYQIKDNGSFDAKLNFKVDYSRGGGTSIDIFDVTYNGFLQVKKRLDVLNGFFANNGEEYNFLSTGGTLANTNFFSGTSPISYNSSTGVISTTFTPSSVDTLTNKTFDSAVVPFNKGLSTKFDSNTTTSGFLRFFEATGQGSNFADLHLEDHRIIDPVGTGSGNINVFLPTSVNDTILVGRNTADTLTNKTITSFTGNSSATITTPSTTGTLALANATHTSKWNDSSNIYTPTNSSLTSIDLPQNTKIRDANDTNDFIQFKDNIFHIDYFTIDIRDTCNIRNASNTTNTVLSIQNGYFLFQADSILFKQGLKMSNSSDSTNDYFQFNNDILYFNYANLDFKEGTKLRNTTNTNYYLQIKNGVLESTFTQIKVPTDSYLERDTSSDWIQFKTNILNINYPNIDVVENVKIRNASDTTNDFISFRNNHLYINYAVTEVIQGGKIANGSDQANDYIQFNDNELYINYAVVDVKSGTKFQNASDNLLQFTFESDKIKYTGPVCIQSDFGVHSSSYYPLEVEGYFTAPDTTGSALYYQNIPSLGGRAIAINGDVNMSAKFEYGLYVETGTELWVASDERIKKDITTFTGGLDLLRQLEVKSYKYIDGKGKEPKHNEIGFIAQEVKEIYPKAITLNHEYIPNVYKQISCMWSDFDNKFKMKSNDLSNVVDVDYKFYCWNEGDKVETKITSIGNSDNTFTFNKKWENVFCIGNKVNDFNTLDKQQLFVINFSATKELDNIVKQQQEEINTLKNEVEILKEFMNELITSNSFANFKKKIS